MGDEGKDLGDEALLDAGVLGMLGQELNLQLLLSDLSAYQLGVELCQPGLAGIVED